VESLEGTVRKWLNELLEAGRVERTGKGIGGSPYGWKALSAQPHSLRADNKTGGNGWSAEAADRFIEQAKEMFPGSVELPLDGEGAS
jgi:hypothetical protein